MMKDKLYRVIGNGDQQMSDIEIISGPFKGRRWQYGKVKFVEEGDNCTLFWEYEFKGEIKDKQAIENNPAFRELQGDILMELIQLNVDHEKEMKLEQQ